MSLTCFQQFVWSSCRCTLDDLAYTIHRHMAGMHKDRPAACRSHSESHSIAMDSYSETLEDKCEKNASYASKRLLAKITKTFPQELLCAEIKVWTDTGVLRDLLDADTVALFPYQCTVA